MVNKITLCMIVKDDGNKAKSTIRSVKNHLHYWVVVDTGSTDRTKIQVVQELNGVPGMLIVGGTETTKKEAVDLCLDNAPVSSTLLLCLEPGEIVKGLDEFCEAIEAVDPHIVPKQVLRLRDGRIRAEALCQSAENAGTSKG